MNALPYLKEFSALSRLKFSSYLSSNPSAIKLRNIIVFLHSNITLCLIMFGVALMTHSYFEPRIQCLENKSEINKKILEDYCIMEGIFSVRPDPYQAYIGVGPRKSVHERKVYHRYYHWTYPVLMIQAVMFYMVRIPWKSLTSNLTLVLTKIDMKPFKHEEEINRKFLAQEITDSLSASHRFFNRMIMSTFTCLGHLIFQFWLTDILLGGEFRMLGVNWLLIEDDDGDVHSEFIQNPLKRIFPRLVKCTFHTYGFSGTIQSQDLLCRLPTNVVHEKLFVALWCWYMFLFLFTFIYLICYLFFLVSPPLRYCRLHMLAPSTNRKCLRILSKDIDRWYVACMIASNMKPSNFRDLLSEIMDSFFDRKTCTFSLSIYGKFAQNVIASGGEVKISLDFKPTAQRREIGFTNDVVPAFGESTYNSNYSARNDYDDDRNSRSDGYNDNSCTRYANESDDLQVVERDAPLAFNDDTNVDASWD